MRISLGLDWGTTFCSHQWDRDLGCGVTPQGSFPFLSNSHTLRPVVYLAESRGEGRANT